MGYQVRATRDTATLIKWVSRGDGDLAIVDISAGERGGGDLLSEIRKQRPRLPIIVTSAHNYLTAAVNAAHVGAYEFFSKPFDLNDVAVAAKGALLRVTDTEAAKHQGRVSRDDVLGIDRQGAGYAIAISGHGQTGQC